MSVQDVIKTFGDTYRDLIVKEIYRINLNECLIIAPKKATSSKGEPNSYIFNKNGEVTPINPMENLELFVKFTNAKNRIYDATEA